MQTLHDWEYTLEDYLETAYELEAPERSWALEELRASAAFRQEIREQPALLLGDRLVTVGSLSKVRELWVCNAKTRRVVKHKLIQD